LDTRLTNFLCYKITVAKVKEAKTGCNMAEYSKSVAKKGAVLPMLMMIIQHIKSVLQLLSSEGGDREYAGYDAVQVTMFGKGRSQGQGIASSVAPVTSLIAPCGQCSNPPWARRSFLLDPVRPYLLRALHSAYLMLLVYIYTLNMEAIYSTETSIELHSVTTQKILLMFALVTTVLFRKLKRVNCAAGAGIAQSL
jgi:hypothetical protein